MAATAVGDPTINLVYNVDNVDMVALAKHVLKAIVQINLIVVQSKKIHLVLLLLFLCHIYSLECVQCHHPSSRS